MTLAEAARLSTNETKRIKEVPTMFDDKVIPHGLWTRQAHGSNRRAVSEEGRWCRAWWRTPTLTTAPQT
jgi:hypothetical protein